MRTSNKSKEIVVNYLISFFCFASLYSIVLLFIYGNPIKALILGIVAGLMFASALTVFISIARRRLMKQAPNDCVYAVSANHVTNVEARGGLLFICGERLLFKPHAINISTASLEISYHDIKNVDYGTLPRSVCISTNDSIDYVFIVNNRKTTKQLLEKECMQKV